MKNFGNSCDLFVPRPLIGYMAFYTTTVEEKEGREMCNIREFIFSFGIVLEDSGALLHVVMPLHTLNLTSF